MRLKHFQMFHRVNDTACVNGSTLWSVKSIPWSRQEISCKYHSMYICLIDIMWTALCVPDILCKSVEADRQWQGLTDERRSLTDPTRTQSNTTSACTMSVPVGICQGIFTHLFFPKQSQFEKMSAFTKKLFLKSEWMHIFIFNRKHGWTEAAGASLLKEVSPWMNKSGWSGFFLTLSTHRMLNGLVYFFLFQFLFIFNY